MHMTYDSLTAMMPSITRFNIFCEKFDISLTDAQVKYKGVFVLGICRSSLTVFFKEFRMVTNYLIEYEAVIGNSSTFIHLLSIERRRVLFY